MSAPLQIIYQGDFSLGENTVSNPYDLRQQQSQQCINLILDEHGSLRTRDGTLLQSALSPFSVPIGKLFDWVQTNGTLVRLAINRSAGANNLYKWTANAWTNIGGFAGPCVMPDMLAMTNKVICANGNAETLQGYDGSTLAALAGAPNAAHIAFHLGYLWAWNTSTSDGASASPSSMQNSGLNNSGTWAGGDQVFVAKSDGQAGQGLALYTIAEAGISPTAVLLVWKDFSGYEAVNAPISAATFAIQRIKSDMGCVAPRSIQFVSGFGIIRLTHRGFALYDGVNDTLISEEERPRLFGRDNYTGIDWTKVGQSVATQVPNPPLYICACPVSGVGNAGSLTRVFIYDLVRRAWTVCNFANAISTLQLSLVPNTLPVVIGGDFAGSYVRRYFSSDTTDDGTAINWSMVSRPAFGQSPSSRMYYRRCTAKLFGVPANTPISATFYLGPASSNSSTLGETQTVTVSTATSSVASLGWGSDPWGTSPWGGTSGAINLTDLDIPFDIGRTANNCVVSLSGQGFAKLRGLEWQVRQKPLTRSARPTF